MPSIRPSRKASLGKRLICELSVLLLLTSFPLTADDQKPEKLKFHDDSGKTLFSPKFKDDGAKLVDGDEKELSRMTRSGDKIKIKTADDKPLGMIIVSKDKIRLESPDEKPICLLHRQSSDGWKVEDGQGKRLGTIKHRDYGAELEDSNQKSLYKAKLKNGKTSLRTADDKSVYTTHEAVSAAAISCLGLENVSDPRLRFALMFAVDHGTSK